ncbi:MAG: glycosyltransferase family 4 protein [bacterium]
MRILAASPYYEPEGGGLERYEHEILKRLAARGHDVHAVAFTRRSLPDRLRDGVAVQRMAPAFTVGNTPIHPRLASHLTRMVRRIEPDVIVGHTPVPYTAERASRVAQRMGRPFVATYHAGRLHGSSRTLEALAALDRATAERRMLGTSAGLIAVSPFVRDHALARHRDRVTVVRPGVDTNRFCPNGLRVTHDILFVGPLSSRYRWKGVDVLWRAFQLVRTRMPEAGLVLVGRGDRLAEFRRRAAHDGDRIRLPGHVTENDLVEEYRRAAMLVLPSTTDAEAFGLVLAEANACGRPVIGSRVGGIPDFVRHGDNGLLCDIGDPSDLADRIVEVLADPQRATAMGANGRARVVAEHDWDKAADATETVLERARSSPG